MALNDHADRIAQCVAGFPGRHVLVLGDAILDEYLLGECTRISPEAPVPVMKVSGVRPVLGGAANTAANVVSLGGAATLIALVGDDEAGRTLRRCAAEAGVTLLAVDAGGGTLRKTRVVGQQQQIVRLDYETVRPLGPAVEADLLRMARECVHACDIVVISDYAKGLLSPRLAGALITLAHAAGCAVVVDPRPENRACYAGCDYMTPNWRESRALLGLGDAEPTPEAVTGVARALASQFGTNVVLTLGPHGIAFCSTSGAELFAQPTLAREVFDVSGAGDTVVAAFALARSAGADHMTAVALANRAASVVVGKFGTAMVYPDEVLLDADGRNPVPRHTLPMLARTLRAKGQRIVTVDGAFDVLDSGHLHMLDQARRQGDVLIVGMRSDQSVRASHGPDRPLLPERRRAEMLLALRPVDYVHVFDELDPAAFLEAVKPDVHVEGTDWESEDRTSVAVIRQGGGRVRAIERLPGLSSSSLPGGLLSSGAGS